MWSSVKTEAIVLSVAPHREADRRYRALTPAFGKVECVGRGAQRPRAKLAAHLEPGAVVELEIIKGARSTTVINVERKRAFGQMATSLEHRLLGLTSLSLLDATVQPEAEERDLYDELLRWLTFLELQPSLHPTRSTLLLGSFLLRVMQHLGYDTTLLEHAPRVGSAYDLMERARSAVYPELLQMPLKGSDVEAVAKCIHEQLVYHVPGYREAPFWNGILVEA